jgi:hypothetical protein
MSAQPKDAGDAALEELADLAEVLAYALVDGDVNAAREAHGALGRGLARTTVRPAGVVDLSLARASRGRARRAPRDTFQR